jgi:hypothetical protein
MKSKLLLQGVVGLAVAGIFGCSGGGNKTWNDISSSMGLGGKSAATQPAAPTADLTSTQPADAQATVTSLLSKLQTDIAAKDWNSASTDVQQLAPYNSQLTSDQKTQLAKDQAMIAANKAGSKFNLPAGLIPGTSAP